jgi:glycine cleavage system H protein
MTVLLVISTIILFLSADFLVEKTRAARKRHLVSGRVLSPMRGAFALPSGVELAENHTWMNHGNKGVTTIGLDEFLGAMIGSLKNIHLPAAGVTLAAQAPAITLRDGERRMTLALPVGGKVVEVNEAIAKDPSLARTDPYGSGWLLRIRPSADGNASWTVGGAQATDWLREQISMAKDFLTEQLPRPQYALMQDGGLPVDGALNECTQDAWDAFQHRFASLHSNNRTPRN